MNKTYQPFIIKLSERIIDVLDNLNFFEKEEIRSKEVSKGIVCDFLTDKFIKGSLSSKDELIDVFNEEEFTQLLNKIIVKSTMDGLIEKGLINYIINDENGEELFFLTEKGREVSLKMKDELIKI